MQVISRAGATGDRLQRLRLLVHIGDFFTAYHEKKLSRALEILDDAGIFRNTTERREVQCPADRGTVQIEDQFGQRHIVRVPLNVEPGQTFWAEIPVSARGGMLAEQCVVPLYGVLEMRLSNWCADLLQVDS